MPGESNPVHCGWLYIHVQHCISDDFADNGVFWERCNKYPGSRQQGYVLMRERLRID